MLPSPETMFLINFPLSPLKLFLKTDFCFTCSYGKHTKEQNCPSQRDGCVSWKGFVSAADATTSPTQHSPGGRVVAPRALGRVSLRG